MSVHYSDDQLTLHQGDSLEVLSTMPDASVNCVVTSPPYYGLRDYGEAGQYGLESSPAEYVETMRGVFAEVRRVLAADGTLWLNLGDSYASSPPGRTDHALRSSTLTSTTAKRASGANSQMRESVRTAAVDRSKFLPAKNLLGMPWRVARALQEPQYTGRIQQEADRAWLAAMVDGEGCIAIHRRNEAHRTQPTFAPMVQISNTSLAILQRCQQIAECGSISHSDRGRNRRIYRWCAVSNDARRVLREVYLHLVAKQPQARAAVASPSSGSEAERAWLEIKALNKGGNHDGGWPIPAGMTEPGWILRNAVVWSKPNAMPESVTDRLSTTYEHVFLFVRSPRYWFDLDAIRTPHMFPGQTRTLGGKGGARASKRPEHERHIQNDGHRLGGNPGDVWTIPTKPFPAAHFAVMSPDVVEQCILAGCSPGGVVLDPFCGSGTTGLVALKHGHRFVGIDLSAKYLDLALRTRLAQGALIPDEVA